MAETDCQDDSRDDPQQIDIDELGGDDNDTVPCPNCGQEVYEDTDRCPYCGHWVVLTESYSQRPIWQWFLIPAVIIAMLIYLRAC